MNLGIADEIKLSQLIPLLDYAQALEEQREENAAIIVEVSYCSFSYLYYCYDAGELSNMYVIHPDLKFYKAGEELTARLKSA